MDDRKPPNQDAGRPVDNGTALPHAEKRGSVLHEFFRKVAARIAHGLGSPWAFAGAVLLVIVWAALGPALKYSEEWQLVINTGTTIATFLMLFILQNSQNRDTKAVNLKLDELLRAIKEARTSLADIDDMTDEDVDKLEGEFRSLAINAKGTAKGIADAAQKVEQQPAANQ